MPKPKLYRDPIHDQISYRSVPKSTPRDVIGNDNELIIGWAVASILDTPEYQRLRHIRQNGFANYVFHGMEHSRFSHSMGVAYVAREMYEKICRNSDIDERADINKATTCLAALLHDVGHGPFSHTIEEIIKNMGDSVSFNHEKMTVRIIEEDSSISHILKKIDPSIPGLVSAYVKKKKIGTSKWYHKIVSSQLDADRLDYVMRDSAFAGLLGHSADTSRILQTLFRLDDEKFAVDARSQSAVEGFLVTLEELYKALYYHPTIRAANTMLQLILQRAVELFKNGAANIFESHRACPLKELFLKGDKIDIPIYRRLAEFQIWSAVERWSDHADAILSDLSSRLLHRRLFKAITLTNADMEDFNKCKQLESRITDAVVRKISHLGGRENVKYYSFFDKASRTSYKRYDPNRETPDESIWIKQNASSYVIEDRSKIVDVLRSSMFYGRFIVPEEVKSEVTV